MKKYYKDNNGNYYILYETRVDLIEITEDEFKKSAYVNFER